MVVGYNAYNSTIMANNGLILDHNCYQFRCDREPVVKPTPDQLVGGSNPTRTSHTLLGWQACKKKKQLEGMVYAKPQTRHPRPETLELSRNTPQPEP